MKNPSSIVRYSFIAAIGFLFVGILFTIIGWPAAELFSILGGVASLVFYNIFTRASIAPSKSAYPRHLAFGLLVVGQILKSLQVGLGSYLFLVALVAFLIWVVWSVLEQLPPSEE
ncbi:MAG: hypothetical protein K9G46_13090 [Flavobacteriales bacterium]|jgi:hypothetical protein|nr:hypothetical protein [Flavobacteriales bacterium]